jgi:FkbM family methyltransferase
MDLYFNRTASFTKWVVKSRLLREPLVVIDVGVLGGENMRWHLLGEYLVVHGFDAIEEEIEKLRHQNKGNSNRHYHLIAAGNEDGERDFHFNTANPTSSSIYAQGEDRSHHFGDRRTDTVRRVPVRRLDTLVSTGTIPQADFLKVDVEGFEKDVFDGARGLLNAGMLGVETETNFSASPTYPNGHFATLHQIMLKHHLVVFDLAFNRVPRESYQQALARKGVPMVADQSSIGRISTVNALFLRDLIDEADRPHHYLTPPPPVTIDKLLKTMIIYELHGLNDMALDSAERFRGRLGERLDVDRAIELLADRSCRGGSLSDGYLPSDVDALKQRVRELEGSSSWRITAPLRRFRAAATKLFPRK